MLISMNARLSFPARNFRFSFFRSSKDRCVKCSIVAIVAQRISNALQYRARFQKVEIPNEQREFPRVIFGNSIPVVQSDPPSFQGNVRHKARFYFPSTRGGRGILEGVYKGGECWQEFQKGDCCESLKYFY